MATGKRARGGPGPRHDRTGSHHGTRSLASAGAGRQDCRSTRFSWSRRATPPAKPCLGASRRIRSACGRRCRRPRGRPDQERSRACAGRLFAFPARPSSGAIIGGLFGGMQREVQELRDALTEELVEAESTPLTDDGLAMDFYSRLCRVPELNSRIVGPATRVYRRGAARELRWRIDRRTGRGRRHHDDRRRLIAPTQ